MQNKLTYTPLEHSQKYINILWWLRVVLCFVFNLSIEFIMAQECQVGILGESGDVSVFQQYVEKTDCDINDLQKQLEEALSDLFSQGYLLATYSISEDSSHRPRINVFVGPKYKWVSLSPGNIPEVLLSKIGFREKFFNNNVFRITELNELFKRVIRISEQEGYPFASIRLDSLQIINNEVSAVLNMDQGISITYDSISLKSDFRVKKAWLAAHLDVKYGNYYNQKSIDNLESRLNSLNFLRLNRPPIVTFQNEEATIELHIEKNPNNRVDGIIGFLPNEEEEGRLLVTGEFDLYLNNLFNSGKELNIKWQSLKARSQYLDFDYYHRNVFRSSLDFSASFEILKEDTLFINRQGDISFSFSPAKHSIEIFTKLRSSRLLSTEQFREATELPEIIDFNLDYYGITHSYNYEKTIQPEEKHFGIMTELAVGSKRVRQNNGIPAELYLDTDLRSIQYNLNTTLEVNWPISKNFAFFQRISAGKIINKTLFLNDLYRIGGLNSLRGYNENFFFASDYMLVNSELRLYFQEKSYLFTFYDQSYLYYNIESSDFEDYPLGVGIGLNLATKSGIVNLAYAVGNSKDQNFDLSLSKFHFGYVAKF